jgi:hypothetical protein
VAVAEAGGGSSTNGTSSDTPFRPKKRVRQPDTWKKTVAKVKRARGEEYVSPGTGKWSRCGRRAQPVNARGSAVKHLRMTKRHLFCWSSMHLLTRNSKIHADIFNSH